LGREADDIRTKVRTAEDVGRTASQTGSKREQLTELENLAKENSLWIDDISQFGRELPRGGENEVYYKGDGVVHKLNNFEYAGDNTTNFFDRIDIH
jgi:hypothetical protein